MPKSKRKTKKSAKQVSNKSILATLAIMAALVALISGAAWLGAAGLGNGQRPGPVLGSGPAAEKGADLARVIEERLAASPLDRAGELASHGRRDTSLGAVRRITWVGHDETSMILARKLVEEALREKAPGVRIASDRSADAAGDRIVLMAGLSSDPEVQLEILNGPPFKFEEDEIHDVPTPDKTSGAAPDKPAKPEDNKAPGNGNSSPPPSGNPGNGSGEKPADPPPGAHYDPPITPDAPGRPDMAGKPGTIAIIIDDIGNDPRAVDRLLAIGVPLTYSVLPNLPHTETARAKLRQAGADIMLHMPMEPRDYPRNNPGRGALMKGMNREEIRTRLAAALGDVPEARGVNNHMGSAFTADAEGMSAALSLLQERGLFFVDSRTSGSSVAYSLARRMGLSCAERRVFLDHHTGRDYIRKQVMRLAAESRKGGIAIGIGHPHASTIDVLAETLPELQAQGYTFVTASEAVR